MCTSPNIPERRKTPPLRGRLVKWEYTNAVSKITLSVCLADDGIVRVTYFTGPVPEDEPSYAVSPGYSAPGAEVREYDEAEVHVIETSLLRIRIRTEEQKVDFYDIVTDEPLLADEGGFGRESKDWTGDARVWIRKRLQDTEHFFGLGDKPCALNLRGKYFSMWGADHYDFHEESDPLYKSVPFFLSLREGKAYGLLFDNTCRSYFDFGASDEKVLAFGSFGGLMNYYFIYDRSPLDIVAAYTRLTARPNCRRCGRWATTSPNGAIIRTRPCITWWSGSGTWASRATPSIWTTITWSRRRGLRGTGTISPMRRGWSALWRRTA